MPSVSSKVNTKTLSRDGSAYLDKLGFSKTDIWMRIRCMNISSKVSDLAIKFSIKTNNERMYVGSLREGLGFQRLSDIDVLQVDHNFICTKSTLSPTPRDKIILKLIDTDTPPGYCRLQLDNSFIDTKILEKYKYACVEIDDQTYLSSKMFVTKEDDDMMKADEYMKRNTCYETQHGPSIPRYIKYPIDRLIVPNSFDEYIKRNTCYETQHGPSIPRYIKYPIDRLIVPISFDPAYASLINGKVDSDFVRALLCDGHPALNSWLRRLRLHNWPPKKLVLYIMNLPVYVVPVGQKGSVGEYCEWRVSFVQAEIMLVQSFNNVQSKIYVLLKLCAKHYLNTDTDIISSYIIKNIMFWFAERVPQRKFRQKHLISRMIDALQMLKEAVATKVLPCYMLPERNLLGNELLVDDAERNQVLCRINELISNGTVSICEILYNWQVNVSPCSNITDKLRMYNMINTGTIYAFFRPDIATCLFYRMLGYKMKCEKELIFYSVVSSNWHKYDGVVFDKLFDQYHNQCLIKAESDLKRKSVEDMRPGSLQMIKLYVAVMIIRIVTLVLLLPWSIYSFIHPRYRDYVAVVSATLWILLSYTYLFSVSVMIISIVCLVQALAVLIFDFGIKYTRYVVVMSAISSILLLTHLLL